MESDWITLSVLGTAGGVIFTVTLVTQFVKGLIDKVVKVPTRLIALLLAWAVLLSYRLITAGSLSFEGVFLDTLNGFLVALSSMGAHSMAKDHLGWK